MLYDTRVDAPAVGTYGQYLKYIPNEMAVKTVKPLHS